MADNNTLYGEYSDEMGERYYCPLAAVTTPKMVSDEIPDDCIEASVVGRYAGNIQLAGSV